MELLFLTTFGKAFIPKKVRPHLRLFFERAGRDDVPYQSFGILFWLSTLFTYIVYITQVYPSLGGKGPIAFFLLTVVVWTALMLAFLFAIGGIGYFWLTMHIYRRTKEMEERLPDYLTLVSTSLKGGYSFEKALWAAIKPEFGILAKEIGLVSKRVMTGNDVGDALNEFAQKYNSPILRRAMDLIIGELESGGKVVDVIDRLIHDLKKTRALKEEMAASTLTYMIFISALVMFVMPLLFALSYILFNVISSFIGSIVTTGGGGSTPIAAMQITKPGINPADYKLFTIIAICIISGSSALLVSIIEKGDIRAGLKYVPMFLLTSLFLYFLFVKLLGGLFGKLVTFG
jgi:Flp pilus assembly protein TadB